MSHVPHDLHEQFPEAGEVLHRLKVENLHYRNLAGAYAKVNEEIHRIETGLDAASDERLEELKKQRLGLLDEISVLIGEAQTA